MHEYRNDEVEHYFTVITRGNGWYGNFWAIDQANPLGPRFLGHKEDLDQLYAFLADEFRPRVEPDAVLHIFMPEKQTVVFSNAVRFPEEMRPFRIHGELGN